MRDSEVVASIVAGDPVGLAEAYDRYADPLYKYCLSMLSDPADAADAVQDTFVIAASHLQGLRDPELLRPWLYAVARNERLRILRVRETTAALDEAPEVTDEGGHVGDDAERADLQTLVQDATWGLNPAEREAIELQLRQGLEPAEIAVMLGVSRNHVHSLLSRARDQLQACLGVLLVGRAGREECRDLATMLSGWDGHLTVSLRRRIHRHIEHCPVCTARRAYELRPAMLLGLSPGAAILAGAAESLVSAAGPPAALRAHTLTLAAGGSPSAMAHRAAVLRRAGSFGRHGFPRPVKAPMAGPQGAGGMGAGHFTARERATVAAGVLLAVGAAAAVVAFALAGNAGHGNLAEDKPPASAPVAAASGSPASSASPAGAHSPSSPAKAKATPTKTAAPTPTPSASPTRVSPSATTSPTPTPSRTTASPTPSPGTLGVSPAGGQLTVPSNGATITLSAQGGPVNWSIAVSGGLGHVTVQPSSGTLRQGASVSVTIWAKHLVLGRQLTVSPGGTEFTLMTGWGAGQLQTLRALSAAAPARVTLLPGHIVFWLYGEQIISGRLR